MAQTQEKADLAADLLLHNHRLGDSCHGSGAVEEYTAKLADRDAGLFLEFVDAYASLEGIRMGDFVQWVDGTYSRVSHHWGDSVQTTRANQGSFYVSRHGSVSFSGSLDPSIPLEHLEPTGEMMAGNCWTFSGDFPGASRGVWASVHGWRVYRFRKDCCGL